MSLAQIATLLVLVAVVVALASEQVRADLVTLTGAGVLCLLGIAQVDDVQTSFASPAILALASLFVMIEALHLTGAIGVLFTWAERLVERIGKRALPVLIGGAGALSGFMNNTPLVVLGTSVLQQTAHRQGWPIRRLLIPLSYATILGGTCTLIGSSTNLLVDEMVRKAGLHGFSLFEMSGVGLAMAAVGAPYLALIAPRLIAVSAGGEEEETVPREMLPFHPVRAFVTLAVLAMVIGGAVGGLPIAIAAFVGAIVLIAARILTPDEAYAAVKPQLLVMIAGMLVIGAAIDRTGLGAMAAQLLSGITERFGPWTALAIIYLTTLILTEFMSHAGAAVLITPIAIGIAQDMGADPRPFAVAVMMAASASFLTPFGYQTNTIVYHAGGYRYGDFVKVGLPLTLLTASAALFAIPYFFPF
ncbi:SLC13 family permease [Sphingomonas oligophenolica]|uniref:SLC13/DASS family transporter n=1 Tax=Sphingomonas oligophenolica TaxID=301154 RepID=A0A502C3Q8_9SPHN|nr:SLC13 family permease [Sphingomonas oligophenolica]TPG06551.1 SLC13/DASS family transporter [Sphingomonas oligophenolica]